MTPIPRRVLVFTTAAIMAAASCTGGDASGTASPAPTAPTIDAEPTAASDPTATAAPTSTPEARPVLGSPGCNRTAWELFEQHTSG